jgi:hypothetical protein
MHPSWPASLYDTLRMPTRVLLQGEVMADAYDRAERFRALKRAARGNRG